MIAEATIEAQIQALTAGDLATDLQAFAKAQPHLVDYLTTEENAAFTPSEQEVLLFGALVVWRSINADAATGNANEIVKGDRIAELEEANFEILQEQQLKGFRQRITVFFEQSPEEELLAFIEDLLLAEDEEGTVTAEGREPLFICLKTVMDALLTS